MFTLSDIRDIAVQIERNGEAAYRKAAERSEDPQIARLLEDLAEQEKEHAQWFCQMETPPIKPIARQVLDFGSDLLQQMMDQQTFSLDEARLAGPAGVSDVLAQSIEFENDTILFYEMLHSFLDNSETMRHLERIIAEERSHIDRLNQMAATLNQNASI